MMSISKILIVFRKEMLDLFRDKRTIVSSIVVPIILYPILMIGFNTLMSRQTAILHEQEVIIYVLDNAQDNYSEKLQTELEDRKGLQVYQQTDYYRELFNEKIIQAILILDKEEAEDGFSYLNVTITYSVVDEKSELAYSNVRSVIEEVEKQFVSERLRAINISENILRAIEVEDDNVATHQQTLGLILSKILPYLLIIISISGSAVAAVDLVAGEKERGTLETILVSAAQRNELVMGKFLAVISISVMTVVLNLVSIFFSFRHIISQAAMETVAIDIPVGNLLLIMSLMLPMIIFFASVIFSLSTYSRNMKECYSYTQPLMIVAMLLSLITTLPAFETTFGISLIPVINVSLLTRDIMLGDLNLSYYFTTLLSTLFLVLIAFGISVRLFNKEEILFRTVEDSPVIKGEKGKFNLLNPGFATLFFILIVLLFYYVGISWQIRDLESGLIKTLLLLVLLPTLLVIRIGKLNIKETLSLRWTSPSNMLLAALFAVPLFITVTLITQMINIIYPFPESYLEAFQQLMFLEERSIWFGLFLIALLPGVTEEVMFRGYFIKAFKSKGAWNSIFISGILFAVLHLDMFRFVPVALLGFWMGYLLLRTGSIIVPIIAHTANNALALLIGSYGEKIPFIDHLIKDDLLSWWLIFPSILFFVILFVIFDRTNKPLEAGK